MPVKFFQVGGSVRDRYLGKPSKDIDYAVEAESFDAMHDAILARGGKVFLVTPQYLTIRANVPELGACDYVLCRKDGEYVDGRHPETVIPGTIYDDLERRDFTMNAMAIDTDTGELLDPHQGQLDLQHQFLRTVGKAEVRFTEDGLRMFRAIRFVITKDMRMHPDITGCLERPEFWKTRLAGVSVQRVREELTRCFAHDTNRTWDVLNEFPALRRHVFDKQRDLWLKPTLELA